MPEVSDDVLFKQQDIAVNSIIEEKKKRIDQEIEEDPRRSRYYTDEELIAAINMLPSGVKASQITELINAHTGNCIPDKSPYVKSWTEILALINVTPFKYGGNGRYYK
jgi:hypothetical protein